MNVENDWDNNVEGDVLGLVDILCREVVVHIIEEIKTEKTVNLLMCHWSWLIASGEEVMLELLRVLDALRMSGELALSLVAQFSKGKMTSGTELAAEPWNLLSMVWRRWKGFLK